MILIICGCFPRRRLGCLWHQIRLKPILAGIILHQEQALKFKSILKTVDVTVSGNVCIRSAEVPPLKGSASSKNDPPFFADLPKTLLVHSRTCMSFAWKVSYFSILRPVIEVIFSPKMPRVWAIAWFWCRACGALHRRSRH